ncbi:MAG: tRNA (N(6)-L-threonylcarbamoyladenosine(37)-C(2))-methylthiotransferase MtaB [Desulfobacterales bacterium]|nr:tRNA (N(6)-L-threonylcarbamoyladenosine(37)-C(2))-methylthiotransferase MtaB [Desulfobacterales bacterium]
MNKLCDTPIKVKIITLGCKVNQYESEAILGGLKKTGCKTSDSGENPTLMIINTCAVTHKAALQSKQAIRKAIRENPDAVICTTGCCAQSEPDSIADIRGTDFIIGNSHKHLLPEILTSNRNKKHITPSMFCGDIREERIFARLTDCATGNRARPFIKIQDGCNDFCAYCIVPYTRGPSRSRPAQDVIDEILHFSSSGVHEIVLTGIHIGRYGADLIPPSSLLDLLRLLLEKNIQTRIRLSSIEPTELTDDILELTARSDKICPHFHIPLQSGDGQILKKMNRPYSPQLFKTLIEKIHQRIPHAAIGVDVMVGFPGETNGAFANTVFLVESLPVSYLHVFPYSRRRQTPAGRFPDQVPPDIIKSRFKILSHISRSKKERFHQQMIGQLLEVIAENKRDHATGFLKGVSANYVKVFFDGKDGLKNRLVRCRISEVMKNGAVFGKIIA